MMAMPICDSIDTDRLLVKTLGATKSSRAKKLQMIQRPTL